MKKMNFLCCVFALFCAAGLQAGQSKPDAAKEAQEAAAQAREAAAQVKELAAQLRETLALAREAVAAAKEAAALAREAAEAITARESKLRERELKEETARKAAAAAKEAEEREAAAEDEAEKKLNPESLARVHDGRLTLYTPDHERASPQIVGEFVCGGAKYLVKTESPQITRKLQPFDGKQVSLNGKVRNKGKYLIVTDIVNHDGADPVETRKRGGI